MSYIEGLDYTTFDEFESRMDRLDRENNRQEWYGAIADILSTGARPDAHGFFMAKAMLNFPHDQLPQGRTRFNHRAR